MADLALTDTDTVKDVSATEGSGIAGVAIEAGEQIYLDTATTTYKLGNATTEATAKCGGIASNNAGVGQTINFVSDGLLTVSAVLTPGVLYGVSVNDGKLAPLSGLPSTNWITAVALALTTSILDVRPRPYSYQIP